ncbi:transthyretin-like protein isoform X1 [Carex rostrata]
MSRWTEEDWKRCCASTKFAKEMAVAGPFVDLHHAVRTARHIWLNLVDVNGWLEAFANHPAIGSTSPSVSQWCKEEQSKAMSTATDSTMEELKEWNQKYQDKFGFVFLICASGRSTAEILSELKKRYPNRPIVELETAAHEEMKITELRIQRLFATTEVAAPSVASVDPVTKAGDRLGVMGAHLTAVPKPSPEKITGTPLRSRPPITTHVLDVSRGAPASGMEVVLEKWMYDTNQPHSFAERDHPGWTTLGFSETNNDGRSGQLMDILDYIEPGFYRITFNTGKYAPTGFYPYVTLVFQVRENQKMEHFHVPLLHSPFSFTTYRGS